MMKTFDTSPQLTKKKERDINAEPEMIELKRMIQSGELDAARTTKNIEGGIINGQYSQVNGIMEVEG